MAPARYKEMKITVEGYTCMLLSVNLLLDSPVDGLQITMWTISKETVTLKAYTYVIWSTTNLLFSYYCSKSVSMIWICYYLCDLVTYVTATTLHNCIYILFISFNVYQQHTPWLLLNRELKLRNSIYISQYIWCSTEAVSTSFFRQATYLWHRLLVHFGMPLNIQYIMLILDCRTSY